MKYVPLALAAFALAACSSDHATAPIANDQAALSRGSQDDFYNGGDDDRDEDGDGFVYTLSNQAAGNSVLRYSRDRKGTLTPAGSVASGGTGSGAGLGSQNALVLSPDGDLLFAVNAGSNTVSSFRLRGNQLTLVSTASSGGVHPISLTASGGLLYVLNDGGNGNISGLRYNNNGNLNPIANSSRALSSTSAGPAQIQFTDDGGRLIVSEKNTNMIDTYNMSNNGLASNGAFQNSSGVTPFGFAINGSTLVISEAFGGAADAGAVSSYEVGRFGLPHIVTATLHNSETAPCWVAITDDGKFAYSTNTGSGTVSGFAINRNGSLSALDANGVTAVFGDGTAPADISLSHNSRYLYTRNGGSHTIGVARIKGNGSLKVLNGISGLPAGTVGLVAQ
ncbi:MAG: beta-propeller fold lactonase family protein [Gemmatimonadaceae bacterium]